MPTYQPGTLGPVARDPEQKFWDPEIQTMPREQLADLQLSRLQELVDRVLKNPVPLFERKLRDAGVERAEDIGSLDDINSIPTTIKQELRDSEASQPPFGDYRFTDPRECVRLGTSTGTTGTPTDRAVHPQGHLARVRIGRAGLVAERLASRPSGHARAPRVSLRRRRDVVGQPRVLRRAQHVGRAAGYRRARGTGHKDVATSHARRLDGCVQPRSVPGGGGQDGSRPQQGRRATGLPAQGLQRPRACR